MLGMGASLAGRSQFKAHVLLRLLLDGELEIRPETNVGIAPPG